MRVADAVDRSTRPRVGMPIHLVLYADRLCIAAVVTGNIEVRSQGTYDSDSELDYAFSATVFSPQGAAGEAARRVHVGPSMRWHALWECPEDSDGS